MTDQLDQDLYQKVKTNLDSAIDDNGYTNLLEMPAFAVAADLVCFASDCEDCTEDQIVPYVERYMKERKA